MTESVYFPGGGWTTAALATPHLLAAAATAAAASSALGGDGGAGLCGVSSSTIFPDAYPDVALVFFRLDGGCQKVFVESAARLHARGSTWWFDPTRGFPARPFGTTFTAVPRRVGRRPDSGRFVGSVEISGFHGFRLHGSESGFWTLPRVVRRS